MHISAAKRGKQRVIILLAMMMIGSLSAVRKEAKEKSREKGREREGKERKEDGAGK
jgi:hypothetical protein